MTGGRDTGAPAGIASRATSVTASKSAAAATGAEKRWTTSSDFTEALRKHVYVWHAQNVDVSPRLKWIEFAPLGIDFHTMVGGGRQDWGRKQSKEEQLAELLSIAEKAPPWAERRPRVAMTAMSMTHRQRIVMQSELHGHKLVDVLKQSNRTLLWRALSLHQYVLSPPGAGQDCHRTWEIFALGSVPIILTSTLDDLYMSLGLPLIIVSKWEDVEAAVHAHNIPERTYVNMTRLTSRYWKERILAERSAVTLV